MYKRILMVAVTLLLVILQAACSMEAAYPETLYDDYEELIKNNDKFSYIARINSMINEERALKFGTFYGTETLYEVKAGEGEAITIDYSCDIEKGKFKCILIKPNDEIEQIFEGSSEGSTEIALKKGTSRIKIVGHDAGGQFTISIKGSEAASIRRVDAKVK